MILRIVHVPEENARFERVEVRRKLVIRGLFGKKEKWITLTSFFVTGSITSAIELANGYKDEYIKVNEKKLVNVELIYD